MKYWFPEMGNRRSKIKAKDFLQNQRNFYYDPIQAIHFELNVKKELKGPLLGTKKALKTK